MPVRKKRIQNKTLTTKATSRKSRTIRAKRRSVREYQAIKKTRTEAYELALACWQNRTDDTTFCEEKINMASQYSRYTEEPVRNTYETKAIPLKTQKTGLLEYPKTAPVATPATQ